MVKILSLQRWKEQLMVNPINPLKGLIVKHMESETASMTIFMFLIFVSDALNFSLLLFCFIHNLYWSLV